MQKVEFIKITKTQEKYLKELLIQQLYGNEIEYHSSFGKSNIKAGSRDYNGQATKSIKKMLSYEKSLGTYQRHTNKRWSDYTITFNVADVLTKLKNGRQIMDDVMTGLVLFADYQKAYTEQSKHYSMLEKEAKEKGSREYAQFYWDIDDVKTEVGAAHSPYRVNSCDKFSQYKNFINQF